jgi:glyoxylase-like metal-dependent hydrolase (beta-lactamase superfamily II)
LYATKVLNRVYLLDTYALGAPGTVGAYLIKGPKPALVDCGYATSAERVLEGMAEAGVMPSEVRYVIPTHVHLDHAGGAGTLIKRMPNAEVIAHERGVPHLVDPTRLIESSTKVFGKEVVDLYGRPEPIAQERVTPVGEEARIDLGDGLGVTLVHAPGHAPHQVSVLLDGSGALLTADAVGIVYPGLKALIPTTPPPSFNPTELVATIGRLRQTTPRELLTPHFGIRRDADWVFDATIELVQSWVEQVKPMWKRKATLDEVAEEMEKGVARDAGVEDIPLYAKVSVRTSVMGIMHYLDRNH